MRTTAELFISSANAPVKNHWFIWMVEVSFVWILCILLHSQVENEFPIATRKVSDATENDKLTVTEAEFAALASIEGGHRLVGGANLQLHVRGTGAVASQTLDVSHVPADGVVRAENVFDGLLSEVGAFLDGLRSLTQCETLHTRCNELLAAGDVHNAPDKHNMHTQAHLLQRHHVRAALAEELVRGLRAHADEQQVAALFAKMPLKPFQRDFIAFAIDNNVLTFGSFVLKSGRTSPYFFNSGLFNSGEALALLGKYYAAAIADSGLEYDVMFGPAYKGIPLVSSTAVALYTNYGISKPYSFNRKEKKDHGEGGSIVGAPLAGRTVVIDDVMTAGTAIRESFDIIKANGAQLVGVFISLDRQERGLGGTTLSAIQQVEQDYKVPVLNIVSLKHIVAYLKEVGGREKEVESIVSYWKEYGVGTLDI
ncbi:hypothetical protein HDU82_007778 [Entophlyctis luteolus]|nr:hypothetical protein HDU82_007778 [Entophlyctis luteolus]